MMRWKIRVWDCFSSWDIYREGTYDYVYNSCAGYPPAYIWTIEPADIVEKPIDSTI